MHASLDHISPLNHFLPRFYWPDVSLLLRVWATKIEQPAGVHYNYCVSPSARPLAVSAHNS